jgi:hypothetical protein
MSSVSSNSDSIALQKHYNKAYRDLEEAKNEEIRRGQKQHNQDIQQLESSYKTALNKKDEEANQIAENIRNKATEANNADREKAQESIEQLQRDSYNSRGQLASAISLSEHQKRIQELLDGSERRHAEDLANSHRKEDDLHSRINEVRSQASDELKTAHDNHTAQLNEYDANSRRRTSIENEETTKKIAEMNNFVRSEQKNQKDETRRVEDTYSRYLDGLKKNLESKDGLYRDQLRTSLREKDEFLAGTLSKQNLENRQSLNDLSHIYSTQIDQLNQEKKAQDQAAAVRLQSTVQDDHDRLQDTMKKQADTHEMDRQHVSSLNDSRFKTLEDDFKIKTHLTHVDEVPPELEHKIREGVINQYEKNLNSEIDRNRTNHERLAEQYGSNYRKALEEATDRETQIRQQNALEKTRDRSQFFDTLTTTQHEADAKSRDKDANYQLQVDKLQRKFAYAMERQRHEYESIIDVMRSDNEAKLQSIREDDNKESKLTIKSLSEKQSEILRDYDRRLSEQREQYEYVIDDLKTQMKAENHEIEHRSKQEIEVQAKSYEQKIAQLAEQNKEHERYISQAYQEQLEKLRRSYELTSQQKKS